MTHGKKLRRFDAHRRSQSAFFKQKPMLVKDLELALSELIGLFVTGTNLARPLEMQYPLNETDTKRYERVVSQHESHLVPMRLYLSHLV